MTPAVTRAGFHTRVFEVGPPYGATAYEREQQPFGDRRPIGSKPRQRYFHGREVLAVLLEDCRDAGGQRHVPFLSALRRREHQVPIGNFDLVCDVQPSRRVVDLIFGKAEDFALPETAAASQVRHRAVSMGERGPHREGAFSGPRPHAGRCGLGRLNGACLAGVLGEQIVIHGGRKNRGHAREDDAAVRRHGERAFQLAEPVADVRGLEGVEGARPDVRKGVQPKLHRNRGARSRVGRLGCEPLLSVLPECSAADSGIDVLPARHVGLDVSEPRLCEALLSVWERLGFLGAIRADVAGRLEGSVPQSHEGILVPVERNAGSWNMQWRLNCPACGIAEVEQGQVGADHEAVTVHPGFVHFLGQR